MNPEENQGNNNQATPPEVPTVDQAPAAPAPQVDGVSANPMPNTTAPAGPMQPTATEQPTQNQPVPSAQPMMAPAPQAPKKGMSKGMLYGIIAGVAGALLIILVVVLALVFGGPSKQDYKTGAEQMQKVRADYTSASLKMSSLVSRVSYASTSSIDSSKTEFKDSLAAYKTSVEELKDMKALKDKEVKEKYEAFKKKNDEFIATANGLSEDITKVGKISSACDKSTSSSALSNATPDTIMAVFDKAIAPCQNAVKELESSANTVIAQYAKDTGKGLQEVRAVLQEMVDAAKAGDRTKFVTAQSKLTTVTSKYSLMSTKFSSDFRKSIEGKEVKDELNALGKLLTDKANK